MKRLRILHILNGLGFGGAETWLLEIVRLNAGRHQIDFLLTGGIQRGLDKEFEEAGCKLHYVQYSGKKVFTFIRNIRKAVGSEKYHIIHDHEDFVAGWHWLFLLGLPSEVRIAHAHNSGIYIENYLKTGGRSFFYRAGRLLNALLASKITGTSDQLMGELGYHQRAYRKKLIEPLYCGTKPELFLFNEAGRDRIRKDFGFKKSDKVVIFVGRIGLISSIYENHKNPEFAFDLAVNIAKDHSEFKFLFVGFKGELGTQLEEEVEKQGLSASIFFLGTRNDVPDLMSAADIMLFTSVVEPFGLIMVEAQFSGLPVIASDVLTPEVIQFKKLFTLCSLKTQKDDWIKAILSVANNLPDRNDFCRERRQEILQSKFSIQSSFDRLMKHYQNLG